MVCTETDMGLPLYHSDDLHRWTLVSSSLLPPDRLPYWAQEPGLWGPTLVHLAHGWLLYVSALDDTNKHHILAATAPRPAGPWTADAAPLISNPDGAIDPSYFLSPDRTPYLVWKVDANADHLPSYIQIQELNAAGTGLLGQPRTLIRADRPRERRVVEGPVLVHHGRWYYLFYSENVYTSLRYAVGVARARSLAGPWRKRAHPILHSGAPWYGPGGETITTYGRGHTVMLWHADWGPAWADFRRVMAGRLLWERDGWPHIAVG
jgi:beta-xylosidase